MRKNGISLVSEADREDLKECCAFISAIVVCKHGRTEETTKERLPGYGSLSFVISVFLTRINRSRTFAILRRNTLISA